ncbi:DNA repair protein RecO [Candidatus Fermentibacteria bacterium]|nr:DNA repair protein RecO [Candidatus Fermentibacteria bacterium]
MKLVRVDGIVLRAIPFSETSLVGSLLTRQLGRIGVIARGARRPGCAAAAAFQSTNLVSCSVYMGERSGLRTISHLELEATHESIPRSVELFGLVGYAMELVIFQAPEEEPAPRVFRLLKGFLHAADGATLAEAEMALVAFEFRLQRALGWGLCTEVCARCGAVVTGATRLSPREGGTLCPACDPQDACGETLSSGDLSVLRAMLLEPFARWRQNAVSGETVAALSRIARSVWQIHAPAPTRSSSLAFLADVRSDGYGKSGTRSGENAGAKDFASRRPMTQ